jgi:segregation and condensation protein A
MTYTIKLKQFEGPFDLLLFFIERDEIDIHDIPISKITDDFLDYIRTLESLNLDVASEFILVAASLMRIKSRLLIPRKEKDEDGNEIDPRQELVERLLEYKKYKDTIEDWRRMEEDRRKLLKRGNLSDEVKSLTERAMVDAELETLTLYKLLTSFKNVVQQYEDRKREKRIHTIFKFEYTVKDQQDRIFTLLTDRSRCSFENIFESCENRIHAIVTFLALLELLNLQMCSLTEGEDVNSFWITLKVNDDKN